MKPQTLIILAALFALPAMAGINHGSPNVSPYTLQAKIGAGGWLVGMDTANDGTTIFRADTYGGYELNKTNNTLSQIITQSTMPTANFGWQPAGMANQASQSGGGIYEIMQCPTNSSIIYMAFNNAVFVSTNGGTNWYPTTFAETLTGNGTYRYNGRKMAVDPSNCDHVLIGSDTAGLFQSTNGTSGSPPGSSDSWSSVSTVPTAGNATGYEIAFDPATATTIYASSNNAQVYVSLDGGSTWSATSGGPASIQHMIVHPTNHLLWAADMSGGAGSDGNIWTYTPGGTGWVEVTSGSTPKGHTVAIDPTTTATVAVGTSGGGVTISYDSGSTWRVLSSLVRTATDIPWLAWTNEKSMSNGDMQFDPSNANTLRFSEGIGAWVSNPPNSGSTITWTSTSAGDEQLVVNYSIAPNGSLIAAVQDRGFLATSGNSYPLTQNLASYNSYSVQTNGFSADYAAGNTSFLSNVQTYNSLSYNLSGNSSDGGQTWQPFNDFYVNFDASATNCGSGSEACLSSYGGGTCGSAGQVDIAVPSTAALSTWSAGVGTIVNVISYNNAPNTLRRYWYACVAGVNDLVLVGSTYSSALKPGGGPQWSTSNYIVYHDTGPYTDLGGLLYVLNAASDGGLIKITVGATLDAFGTNQPVCISGITAGSTVEANGCWLISNVSNAVHTFDLQSSAFVNAFVPGDGGVATTWTLPGGSNAVASSSNIGILPADQGYPLCTTDGGHTWTELETTSPATSGKAQILATIDNGSGTGPGDVMTVSAVYHGTVQVGQNIFAIGIADNGQPHITARGTGTGGTGTYTISSSALQLSSELMALTQSPGFSSAYYFWIQHNVAADRVTANTLYFYTAGNPGNSSNSGIYVSTNCGTPTLAANHYFGTTPTNSQLKSVPGNAGHLIFTAGPQDTVAIAEHPTSQGMYLSTDGGATWNALPNLKEVRAFDVSLATAPSMSYPVVYIDGWINNEWGIWRSTNFNAGTPTWEHLLGYGSDCGPSGNATCAYPLGSQDNITGIAADGTTWNRFYVCWSGSGCGQFLMNFLLRRDLDPASNDNRPVGLEEAA